MRYSLGLGSRFWELVLEDRFIAKRFGIVEPGVLYRSGQISQYMLEPTLKKHGIKVIIDMNGVEDNDPHQAAEIAFVKRTQFEHYRYQLSGDGLGDIQNYARALETIHQCRLQNKPVLVHCSAGSQRTGGVVAMFRILLQNQSPETVVQEMQRYDWSAEEDQILLNYLNENMEELAKLLVEKNVIEKVPNPLPKLV